MTTMKYSEELEDSALVGFGFVLAYNYKYNTSNKEKFKKRVFIWAMVSQIPFMFMLNQITFEANILFLFLLSMYAIDLVEGFLKNPRKVMNLFYIALLILLSYFTGYFVFGLTYIVFVYLYFSKKIYLFLLLPSVFFINYDMFYDVCSLLSFIFIYNINIGVKTHKIKGLFFYLFYPLHMMILFIISTYYA